MMKNNITIKTEDFQTNNTVYSYVFVNEVEVGFIANDVKKKEFLFYYDDLSITYSQPVFKTKKDMVLHLEQLFGME